MRLASLLLFLLASTVTAADWPQFLGPTRNGHSPDKGLVTRFGAKGPPLLWEKKVGDGYSSPVIADGRLILFHRVGDEDRVECLDAATGKEKWSFAYTTEYRDQLGKGDGPRATPAIDGKHVYTLAADGRLHCLTLAEGKKVWMADLNATYGVRQGFFGVSTSPLVEGDLVVVNVGGTKAGIVALDKATGKEAWTSGKDAASYASPAAATINDSRYLVFFTRLGLVLLDPKTGAEKHRKRWRARIDASVNAASPLVVGDEMFVSSSYNTGALLARVTKAGLDEVWSNDESLSAHYSTPVVVAGHLYGFDGRQEEGARLRCVEWKTGKVKWTQENFGCGSIIHADGQLIALNEGGELILLEPTPKEYREKARAKVFSDTPVRSHLALANGRLYSRDEKSLRCWNLKAE